MRKVAIFSGAFALAAAAYVYRLVDAYALWITAGALGVSVLCRLFSARRVSIFCLGAAVSLLWCLGYEQLWLEDVFALDGTEQYITIDVAEAAYRTDYGAAVYGNVNGYGAVLYADETLLSARPGDVVSGMAQIVVQTDNLHDRAEGAILYLYAKEELVMEQGEATVPQRLRMWLQTRIDELYEGQTEGLVLALLTGDRAGLSFATSNALSVSGLRHAVAVSGMHISILITMIAMICGYQPKLMALFGVPAIFLFALMTGASASVCRAAVMQSMLLFAPLVRRERDNATTLAAAALLLLVQDPWCIASISFQLSFAAVAGLMLFCAPMQERLLSIKKKPGKILRFVVSGVSATLSATLTTLPLTICYFGIVSIAAPLVNLLTLWAVTGVFTLGLSSCFLGSLGPVAAFIVRVLGQYILKVAEVVSSVPYAAAYPQNVPLMVWAVLLYFLAAAAFLFKGLPLRWLRCIVTALFLGCILTTHIQFVSLPWQLTALDVGQGQCIVLRIGDFITVIDCGGSDPQNAGEKAARYLHSAGVTHADALVLTHYDEDHAGGAAQFLSRIHTDTVYLPRLSDDGGTADAIGDLARLQYVTDLIELTLPTGKLILYPPGFLENEDNSGVCVLATAGEYDILITRDLDSLAEMRLMSVWEIPDVELMVAGHHGAKSSTSQVLLDRIRPETVVISVGANNSYGHPHKETLNRLQNIGAQIYRTDILGDISIHP